MWAPRPAGWTAQAARAAGYGQGLTAPELEPFGPTGSAADLCKMAMIHVFTAVATSPTLTARSVSELPAPRPGPRTCPPWLGVGLPPTPVPALPTQALLAPEVPAWAQVGVNFPPPPDPRVPSWQPPGLPLPPRPPHAFARLNLGVSGSACGQGGLPC